MEFRGLAENFPEINFFFLSRDDLAIEDAPAVTSYFLNHQIDVCINCAAYTAVDRAETEQAEAIAINATAVGNLAFTCAEHGSRFIHFSTDYVFNGKAEHPYMETDETDPVNFYGRTKLSGENLAMKYNPAALILRTSWVYSRHGKNFVKTMQRLFKEKTTISVVADQFGCPTYAADLADAVMQIINAGNFFPGIYHYANHGIISWHQFALAIKEIEGSSCMVNAISTKDYPTPAARPAYSAFDTTKIQAAYGIEPKDWRHSLGKCLTH